jgi:hypothetical protein
VKRTNVKLLSVAAVAILATAMSAQAGVIALTFAGVSSQPYPFSDNPEVLNFYDGGTSSDGTTGTNYGISFPSSAQVICLNTLADATCSNTSKGGLGPAGSMQTAMFFLNASTTFLDDPAGFTTGFAFDYVAVNDGGSIEVWSGLDGGGTLLASLTLPTTPIGPCAGYGGTFCPFVDEGLTFAGTAMSIEFDGVANQIVYDDITFGSAIVGGGGAPEPGTVFSVVGGLAAIGWLQFRRRKSRANG